ncbi:MAG: FkbM family methyltransferase [Candidatus Methanomethylicaceae archaeon]
MSVRSAIRTFVDNELPQLARNWRKARDWWIWSHSKLNTTKLGFVYYGDPLLFESRMSSGEIALVDMLLSANSIFCDVGANVGVFTLYARSRGHHVVAIEPEARNFALLCRNLSINGFTDVELFHTALGDEHGLISLYGSGEGASLLQGWGGIQSTYSSLVPVTTMDRLLSHYDLDIPMVIKVDVEGSEYKVLLGAKRTLRRLHVVWIVENGLTRNFQGINPHFRDVFEIFWSQGYLGYSPGLRRFIGITDIERWVEQGTTNCSEVNYVFVRPGSRAAFMLQGTQSL